MTTQVLIQWYVPDNARRACLTTSEPLGSYEQRRTFYMNGELRYNKNSGVVKSLNFNIADIDPTSDLESLVFCDLLRAIAECLFNFGCRGEGAIYRWCRCGDRRWELQESDATALMVVIGHDTMSMTTDRTQHETHHIADVESASALVAVLERGGGDATKKIIEFVANLAPRALDPKVVKKIHRNERNGPKNLRFASACDN